MINQLLNGAFMINILTSTQMRDTERYTMEELGITSMVLMERAALSAFNLIMTHEPKKVIVFAGSGNNGADGIAVARMMLMKDVDVTLCLIGNREKATKENIGQLQTYLKLGGRIADIGVAVKVTGVSDEQDLSEEADVSDGSNVSGKKLGDMQFDIIVDALLGIGISRELEGDYLKAVKLINSCRGTKKSGSNNANHAFASRPYIFSLDIPTGLNTDNGKVMGIAVIADETICFSECKRGLILSKGPEYAGKVSVYDVGIVTYDKYLNYANNNQYLNNSDNIWGKSEKEELLRALSMEDSRELMPKREIAGHKGTFGKVLVIAGSEKMAGAALLSSKAAFATGAGMVKLISPQINRQAILSCLPELMYEDADNITDVVLMESINWADIIILGPGLSMDDNAKRFVEFVMLKATKPVVVDADAINIIAANKELLIKRKAKDAVTIMTPHPGEFNKVFADETNDVQNNVDVNSPECVRSIANKYGIVLVAKNARTLISNGMESYVNLTGNSGMATAGCGDVLTGIMAVIMHNFIRIAKTDKKLNSEKDCIDDMPLSLAKAAALAVFIHGQAGDMAAADKNEYSVTPSDIIEAIPRVIELIQ